MVTGDAAGVSRAQGGHNLCLQLINLSPTNVRSSVPLEKRSSDRIGTVAVTFRIPADAGAATAALLGDFSDWAPMPMTPTDDGGHVLKVDLPAGVSYRFRYLLDGERWANDWQADDYVANNYGSDDSVVVIGVVDADVEDAGTGTPAEPAQTPTADTPKPDKPAKAAAKRTRAPRQSAPR
jgi:hypothetical protein